MLAKLHNDTIPAKTMPLFSFSFCAFPLAFARNLFMSDYDMGDGGQVFRTC